MVSRVAYDLREYRRPQECVAGIREHVEHGWAVAEIRGRPAGPFVVTFRIEDREASGQVGVGC
jgi:hypothetical protein